MFGGADLIMKLIPKPIKVGTIVGVGMLVTFYGFSSVGIIVYNPSTLVTLGSLASYKVWLTFLGLILIVSLMYHNVKGAILIEILVLSLISWWAGDSWPKTLVQWPTIKSAPQNLIDFTSFDFNLMAPAIASFLFVELVVVGGVLIGLASQAKLGDGKGVVPGSVYVFLGCGFGTMVGAATGSTPVILYADSGVGIKDGGRTGVTALTTSLLFVVSLFLAPLFSQVPSSATAPIAIFIGIYDHSLAIFFLYFILYEIMIFSFFLSYRSVDDDSNIRGQLA